MTSSDLGVVAGALVIGGALSYAGAYAVAAGTSKAECLSYGYSRAEVDMYLVSYCVRRLDQTDVVVPLEKVRRERS